MASRQWPVLRRLRGADGFRSRRDATDQASCAVHFVRALAGPARDGLERPARFTWDSISRCIRAP